MTAPALRPVNDNLPGGLPQSLPESPAKEGAQLGAETARRLVDKADAAPSLRLQLAGDLRTVIVTNARRLAFSGRTEAQVREWSTAFLSAADLVVRPAYARWESEITAPTRR